MVTLRQLSHLPRVARSVRDVRVGGCPVCEGRSVFVRFGADVRETDNCLRCWTTPRQRAVWVELGRLLGPLSELAVHESSPGGALSTRLAEACPGYVASQWFADVPSGRLVGGVRREDLQEQTFEDESFDLVLTQDVFEHVHDPRAAFVEVLRTLRPGGVHVFTVPWDRTAPTRRRVEVVDGELVHLLPPVYHENPLEGGSLVITDWGSDLPQVVQGWTDVPVEVVEVAGGAWAARRSWPVFLQRRPAAD